MSTEIKRSAESGIILKCLAEGLTVEQMLSRHAQLDYREVAQIACGLLRGYSRRDADRLPQEVRLWKQTRHCLKRIKERYPKAYTPWTDDEQDILRREYMAGLSIWQLSDRLDRQPGSIKKQLVRLGLITTNLS